MFFGESWPLEFERTKPDPHHYLYDLNREEADITDFVLLFIILFIIFLCYLKTNGCGKMNGVQKILHLENIDVDEKLENYFDTLTGF